MSITKDKVRGTWMYRVYVEDKYGNKKQVSRSGFKTKSEAKLKEEMFLAEYNKSFNDLTFEELYYEYIKYKSTKLKHKSIKSLTSRYKNHILPYFKDYKVSKIDHKVYINWQSNIDDKDFSWKYKSNLHTCVVMILNYAMDFYGLEKNIAEKVKNFPNNGKRKEISFWTLDEFDKYILEVDNFLYKVFYHVLYYTGMRQGECLALRWDDLKEDYIIISKTISQEKHNGKYLENSPKTERSNRRIKLDIRTLELLNDLKDK